MNDDPREVLSLLNSLGFVGITAHQLKAFMKDLKLYRKIKERERQQRKEEIRRKIVNKQQSMISEILREQNNQVNGISSDSSNFYPDDSLVKVRVKCVSEETTDHDRDHHREFREKSRTKNRENLYTARTQSEEVAPTVKSSKHPSDYNSVRHSLVKDTKDNNTVPKRLVKTSSEKANIYDSKRDGDKVQKQGDSVLLDQQRAKSAPDLVHSSNRVESTRTRSASSTRNSTHSGAKSFIRPWRLQPDVLHKTAVKKSDPVTLYHKYQEEWKRVSFPGEAKHGNIRWAVRERMLGTDPHPAPLPRKSNSVPALRKK